MFWKRKNAKSNEGESTGGKAKVSLFSELKEYKKEKEEKKKREKEEKAYAVTHSERYLKFQKNYRAWQEWNDGGEESYYHDLFERYICVFEEDGRRKTEEERDRVRWEMVSAFNCLSDEEKAAARKEMAKDLPRKRLKHGEPGRSSIIGAPFIFWYELTDGMDGWMKFFTSSAIIIVLLFCIAFALPMCHSLGVSSCSDSTSSSTTVSKSYKSNSEDLVDGDVDDDDDEDDEEELTEEEKAAKKKEEKKLKKKLKNLDKKLPFVGMPVEYISSTYLGGYTKYKDTYVSFSDEEGKKLGRKGRSYKARIYYWRVGSNKNRDLFRATVSYDDYFSDHDSRFVYMYGKVTSVEKLLTSTNYWPTGSKLPDLENGNFGLNKAALKKQEEERAEEEKEAKKSKSSSKKSVSTDTVPDPSDYGSATAYADSEQYWFRDHGYANPYDAAYDYFKSYGDDRDFEEL